MLALADLRPEQPGPGSDEPIEAVRAGEDSQANLDADMAAQSQVVMELGQGAAAATNGGNVGDGDETDFKLIAKRWREMAYRWACQNPDLTTQFILIRVSLGPQVFLMTKFLQVSADAWSAKEIEKELRTGERNYRIVWAAENHAPKQALESICKLIDTDFSDLLPLEMFTTNRSHDFFRILATVGAATYHYLHQRHGRYPFLLFKLLSQDLDAARKTSLVNRILLDFSENRCVMDDFSTWYCRSYAPNLLCAEGIQELQAIATGASIDISHTECQHAGNRKLVESRKVNTHCPDLAQASSQFIARSFRRRAWLSFNPDHGAKKQTSI